MPRIRTPFAALVVALAAGLVAALVAGDAGAGTKRAKRLEDPIPGAAALADSLAPALRIEGAPGDTALAALGATIQRIATRAGGTVGFAALHLESGERLSLRGDERFPMASVYKVPIALTLLHEVACDRLALEDSVAIGPADLRTGSGWIWYRRRRVKELSLAELLEAMMVDSDNTASDLLMRTCGGPEAVSAHLRRLGINGIRVDRLEAQMALDYAGVLETPPDTLWTVDALWKLKKEVPLDRREESARAFLADPRDTATPDAMADLLALVWGGRTLGLDETSRLLEIMERARTGPDRIPGFLPPGTPVAHKTGTWSTSFGITAAVNDVGIVTLPEGAGHLAIAVFVKGTNRGPRRAERVIAALSRAAYDHWTTNSRVPRIGG